MELRRAKVWVKQHIWWAALVICIFAGYSIGKDRALRDNRQASAQFGEAI